MRTKSEIKKQIEGLVAMKKWLPECSSFGDANHHGIDAQLDILESITTLEDYDNFNENIHAFEEDDLEHVRSQAEEADEWLNGTRNEDLFEVQE